MTYWRSFKNYKDEGILWEPTGEFDFVGYSTDENLLEAKILEYYLENKEKNFLSKTCF